MQNTPLRGGIRKALLSPPAWPEVGVEPFLAGLRRRSLSRLDVSAPSMAAVAPASTALIAPVLITAYVGRGAWLSVVIAIAGALLLRSALGEFTSRMVGSGSLYTFVTRALGAWAGLITAAALIVAYSFACGYALTSTGLAARALATQQMGPSTEFGTADVLMVLALGAAGGLVLLHRVSTFTAITLVVQAVTVAAMLVLVALVVFHGGAFGDALSLSGASPGRIALGATLMLAFLVGFECSASLGSEAARPFRSVPRAMIAAITVTGALCLIATIALSSNHALAQDALSQSIRIEHVWFPGGNDGALAIFRTVRVLAMASCTLALWAVLARLVYTLALEGLLPARLAKADDIRHTPRAAVLWTAPLVVGPSAILLAGDNALQSIAASLLDTTSLVMMIAYLLACLAVPAFLFQLQETTGRAVAVALGAAAMVIAAIATHLAWQTERGDAGFVTPVAVLVIPAGTLWYAFLRLRRPGALRRSGVHDATIAADSWCAAPGGPAGGPGHAKAPVLQ